MKMKRKIERVLYDFSENFETVYRVAATRRTENKEHEE